VSPANFKAVPADSTINWGLAAAPVAGIHRSFGVLFRDVAVARVASSANQRAAAQDARAGALTLIVGVGWLNPKRPGIAESASGAASLALTVGAHRIQPGVHRHTGEAPTLSPDTTTAQAAAASMDRYGQKVW
jgi:hypothetical protein